MRSVCDGARQVDGRLERPTRAQAAGSTTQQLTTEGYELPSRVAHTLDVRLYTDAAHVAALRRNSVCKSYDLCVDGNRCYVGRYEIEYVNCQRTALCGRGSTVNVSVYSKPY